MAKKRNNLKDKDGNIIIPNILINKDEQPFGTNTYDKETINEMTKYVYSTTETKTNKVWIDKKTVYSKVVNAVIDGQEECKISLGISDIDTLVDVEGFIHLPSKDIRPLFGGYFGDFVKYGYQYFIRPENNDYKLVLQFGTDIRSGLKNGKLSATLYYTKTAN